MKFDNIAFVGTYECNTSCDYCYAEKYIAPYKNIELSFERYKEILLQLKENGVRYIIFIGGEPALWKHINEAIKFAREEGMITTVMSNAMIKLKEMPDRFLININVLFMTRHKEIIKNVSYYSKHSRVRLIYNLYDINKYQAILIQKILWKLKVPVSLWIVFSEDPSLANGEYFYKLARALKEEEKIDVEIFGPMPICMFTEEQYVYLKYNMNLVSTCGTPSFEKTDAFTVINPDGQTILPCPPLAFTADIKYLLNNDMSAYIQKFSPHTKRLRQTVPKWCEGCEHHNNKCQYGCQVNKFEVEEYRDGRILI